MQELLSYNINGIPIVFWGFMVALMLAMHCMAHANGKDETESSDVGQETTAVPQPVSDVVIR